MFSQSLLSESNNFIIEILLTYWGNCVFPILFLVGIILTLFIGRKHSSIIFALEAIILGLTVYNPILMLKVMNQVGFQNQYYRLLWVLPVIPGTAYYGAKIFFRIGNGFERIICLLALVAAVTFLGTGIPGISAGSFRMAENIYKVPDELFPVLRILHRHGGEEPIVAMDVSLNMYARQYDPSVHTSIYRDAYLYAIGSNTIGPLDESSEWYIRQKALVDVIDRKVLISLEDFYVAMKQTKTKYIVARKSKELNEYLKSAGCERIGLTSSYYLYYYTQE